MMRHVRLMRRTDPSSVSPVSSVVESSRRDHLVSFAFGRAHGGFPEHGFKAPREHVVVEMIAGDLDAALTERKSRAVTRECAHPFGEPRRITTIDRSLVRN